MRIGSPAPSFSLPDNTGQTVTLESLRSGPVVLYFYPKDDTSGCTAEACDFRDAFPEFATDNASIIGVSPDSVDSHQRFRAKHKLPFTLLADTGHKVAESYGVWQMKKNYGRSYMGIVRTTFIIDSDGILRRIMPVKRVAGHAAAVLEAVRELE
jgi:peroxiredoxin Q/BCP